MVCNFLEDCTCSRWRRFCEEIVFPGESDSANFSVGGPTPNSAPKSIYSFCQILALILALTHDPREMAMLVNNWWGPSSVPDKVQDSSVPETAVSYS